MVSPTSDLYETAIVEGLAITSLSHGTRFGDAHSDMDLGLIYGFEALRRLPLFDPSGAAQSQCF